MACGQRTETLHGLLEATAARRPNHICLKFGDHKGYTYSEVAAAMNRCAAHVASVESDVIGIVADRSYAMLVSMLGVIRAGKAYCPVEPDFPASRAAAMIEGASITHFLVPNNQMPQEVIEGFASLTVWGVRDDGSLVAEVGSVPSAPDKVPADVPDNTTAYVLFTSGSTGKPKGCMVPHRGSCKYARAVVKSCGLTEDMVFLLKTPYVFDVSIQDIYTAFSVGGTLVIADPGVHKDATAITDTIVRHGVNCCCFVPTLLVEFANYLSMNPAAAKQVRASLTHVLTIGEALLTATCRQMFGNVPGLEIHNLYGPTEASVGVSHQLVTEGTVTDGAVVPIGKPLDYVVFRSFDAARYGDKKIDASMLVDTKPGEVGELFIGGDCLAQGYIKNPEKTQEAFFDFPEILARPDLSASPFSLYKTGDLVIKREDGVYEFLGRNDFQVKIGGVRIECEEVSTILQTHPAISDALVTAFDSPYGKALAAYIVTCPDTDWTASLAANESFANSENSGSESTQTPRNNDDAIDKVSKWGQIYDEMYKDDDNSDSTSDPTLNWSGYTDTYSRQMHMQPVIKEWVEWSCEQVSRHADMFEENRQKGRPSCITEIGCGNGMLLFRLAPLIGTAGKGRYIGTDISGTALDYVQKVSQRPKSPWEGLGIETGRLAAHEILEVCKPAENDQVLCNGVTMYFPSADYLLECMQVAVKATRPGGYAIFGDVQSKRHLLPFRASVETYQALRRPDATAAAVLRAAKHSASHEELSYFDDEFFHRLDRVGSDAFFKGRVARLELRVKRGWWHSEFNRFRYDIELVLKDEEDQAPAEAKDPELTRIAYEQLCKEVGLRAPKENELVDSRLESRFAGWVAGRLAGMPQAVDGLVVTVPNARTLPSCRLLEWLEEASEQGGELRDLPTKLHPTDAHESTPSDSARFGLEPEMLFTLQLPEGWTQRVIWDEDPAMVRFVLLRDAAAERPWLGAVCGASSEPLPKDLAEFKNLAKDVENEAKDPVKLANDALKAWIMQTSLLTAMRPAVYIPLETFPKNAAGKTDRGALPDAASVFEQVSDAAAMEYEAPATDEEKKMVAIWEKVLKHQVGVSTPFVAHGGHSLTAIQLCSMVEAEFGSRPNLVFLTSEDCNVRALLRKMSHPNGQAKEQGSGVVRLSPPQRGGTPLIIFCAAGASAATYQAVAEQVQCMAVYAVELPGRGRRAGEPVELNFGKLVKRIQPDVMRWAEQYRDFYVWGDSLGAVIAYEFARVWQDSPKNVGNVLGLYVSGNAGPSVASEECGMGESISTHLGKSYHSCHDMSREDWKQFLLASSSDAAGRAEINGMLADEALAAAIIEPLRADCLVYESYRLEKPEKLWAPIVTMRGEQDHITALSAVESWGLVARGRIEHKEFSGAGHMLAKDCPQKVARHLDASSKRDFSSCDMSDLSQKFTAFDRYLKAHPVTHDDDEPTLFNRPRSRSEGIHKKKGNLRGYM